MNICLVCNEYPEGPHGGVGTMTQLLAEELVIRKHTVKVVGVYNSDYPSEKTEIKNGVEIIRIKVNLKKRFSVVWGYWKVARTIKKWIRQSQIDIIEVPDSYGVFSLFAKFQVPLVLRANGNNTYFSTILHTPLKINTRFYERNLYKRAFGFCAVSKYTADIMKIIYKIRKPVKVIYNAVETHPAAVEQSAPRNRSELAEIVNPIVFSGTLTPKKGVYQLISATLALLNKGYEITLILNGKDTINSSTGVSVKKELLDSIPLPYLKNFRFSGHVTRAQLMLQYKYAKAALFPSFAEAFAFAPMEAMAVGIPVIYSRLCSGEELISHKEDGLLIDPDSPASIADAIEFILENPEEAGKIGARGKKKIESNFTKEIMTAKSVEFYEEIINQFNGSDSKSLSNK